MVKFMEHRDKAIVTDFLNSKNIFKEYEAMMADALKERELELDRYTSYKDVFICHAHKDLELVNKIIKELDANAISSWTSEINMPYDVKNYWNNIEDAIDKCKVFLFVLTDESKMSKDCMKEVELATSHNKSFKVEYRSANAENNIPLKRFFDGIQWVDSDIDTLVERIYDAVKAYEQNIKDIEENKEMASLYELSGLISFGEYAKAKKQIEKLLLEKPNNEELWHLLVKAELKGKEASNPDALSVYNSLLKIAKDKNKYIKEFSFLEQSENPKSFDFKIGDTFKFGKYNNEPISWKVLNIVRNQALIITEKVIEVSKFDDNSNNYKDSFIRNWLNNEFINTFKKEEQERIQAKYVDNTLKSTGDKENDNICLSTNDKLFLLSVEELNNYFKSSFERRAEGVQSVINNPEIRKHYNGAISWWVRTPHPDKARSVIGRIVSDGGSIFDAGVKIPFVGVRPACWINLDVSYLMPNEESMVINSSESGNSNVEIKANKLPDFEAGKRYEVGDKFNFGAYNGLPITWSVLEIKQGKALIFTDKIIEYKRFNSKEPTKALFKTYSANNYEKSEIRAWLNGKFYNEFTSKEKKVIVLTEVDNSITSIKQSPLTRNHKFLCKNTKDYFFLPSYYECDIIKSSKYAKAHLSKHLMEEYDLEDEVSSWWLRSPYGYDEKVTFCSYLTKNAEDIKNYEVDEKKGIRPLMWIKL